MPDSLTDYLRALREVEQEFDSLRNASSRELGKALVDLKKEVALILASIPDLAIANHAQLKTQIDTAAASYRQAVEGIIKSNGDDAFEYGVQYVVKPAMVMRGGIALVTDYELLERLMSFSIFKAADLSDKAAASILQQIRIVALGGGSPWAAMQEVTKLLGNIRGPLALKHGVAYQGERYVRTELGRMFNTGTHSAQQQAKQQIPGLLKRWISNPRPTARSEHMAAHRRYLAEPIPVDKPFEVGGEMMMHPHDPAASARNTINCTCTSVTVVPEIAAQIGRIDHVLQPGIDIEAE